MKTIWKFALSPHTIEIDMPNGSQVLCANEQNGSIYIWAIVDPNATLVKRKFRVIGTGWEFENGLLIYISTVELANGNLIFHVFESFE